MKIFTYNILTSCRAQLEYPKTFVIGVMSQWLGYGVQFATIWILVRKFGNLSGWSPDEVLLLYGFQLLSYGIAALFLANTLDLLPQLIRTGDFDVILTKPINSLDYLATMNFNIGYVGHITLSVTLISICWYRMGIALTFSNLFYLICLVIGGSLITGATLLISLIPSLIWVGENQLPQIIFNLRSFINNPIPLYSNAIQFFLTFILPYGFINFYTVQHFLNRQEGAFSFFAIPNFSIIIGIILLFVSRNLWRVAVNYYQSTGS